MENIIQTDYCDVSYVNEKNVVLVEWKKYCELALYRNLLLLALEVVREHKCNYVADTRKGFEDNPEDTLWVKDYFMKKAVEYGCKCIYFIIDENNSLKEELEGQENDSNNIIDFKYIYTLDEID